MTPYFERDGIVLYHGDCREVLPTLARDSVDLIVTDPPYGVGWQSGNRRHVGEFAKIAGDDGSLDVIAVLADAIGRLRHHRHVYVFGRFDLSALPLQSSVELIWNKGQVGLGNLSLPWAVTHEPLTFAVYVASRANREDGMGRLAARLRQGSVLTVPRLVASAVANHPTEKPVPLLRMLIESSSLLGETVLDPFAGVGSTLVAAALEGRNAVGIEIEERYCEIAARRLEQMPLPLLEVGA